MEELELSIRQTEPDVIIDHNNNSLRISGVSFPADARATFDPIFTWLNDFVPKTVKPILCEFDFEFLNSTSSKMLFEILYSIRQYEEEGRKVNIKWIYEKGDLDMKEYCEDIADMLKMDIEMIEK